MMLTGEQRGALTILADMWPHGCLEGVMLVHGVGSDVIADLIRSGLVITSMCDRLALDASERDDRHGALLDADMTADALIQLEHLLKHGKGAAPRSWTSA